MPGRDYLNTAGPTYQACVSTIPPMDTALGWEADGLGSWEIRNSSFPQGRQKGHGNNLAKVLISTSNLLLKV